MGKIDPFNKAKLHKRLLARSERVNGHLLWTGQINPVKKYGQITIDGRKWGVHRIAAYLYHGLDLNNPDEQALHKPPCDVKRCIESEHLYVGTNADNRKDVRQFPFKCGHPRDAGNSFADGPWFRCKTCRNANQRKNHLKRKQKEV